MIKPTKDEMMHARSIRSSPKQLPITRHTGTTGGTIRTLPIYTSRSYVQAYVTWLAYLQTNTRYKEIYNSISGPFVPAHTNGPHVSYATRVTYI